MSLTLRRTWPILVELIDRYADEKNPLGLTLVDTQKHFEGKVRRGKVMLTAGHMESVKPGDVVLFKATAGFTLDGDPVDPTNPLKGEKMRFLKEHECIAVEEKFEVA